MRSKPPRLLPTLGLVVLWLALYVTWVAVRPARDSTVRRPAVTAEPSTTTTARPLFRLKP